MHMWYSGWMWLWWVFGLAVVIAIVWTLVAAVRRDSRLPEDSPEQILKRRYAAGEIEREDYERMLGELRK